MKSLRAVAVAAVLSMLVFSVGCKDNKEGEKRDAQPTATEKSSFDRSNIPDTTATTPPPVVTPAPAPTDEPPVITPEPAPKKPHKAAKPTTTHKPKEKYATEKKAGGKTYVIKKGDTLQEISQQFYGTTKKWKKIATANKGVIKDPNKLPVGAKIEIP